MRAASKEAPEKVPEETAVVPPPDVVTEVWSKEDRLWIEAQASKFVDFTINQRALKHLPAGGPVAEQLVSGSLELAKEMRRQFNQKL